jgi:hypothetical protein
MTALARPISSVENWKGRRSVWYPLTPHGQHDLYGEDQMRQLLYASNTFREVPDEMLEVILDVSRKNNAKTGITGVLLYLAGGFMQVLEGDDQVVNDAYARICRDKRHWNTTVLLDRQAERSFGEWSMGFERVSADLRKDGMFEITRAAIAGKVKPGMGLEIVALLRTFFKVQSGE